MMKKLIISVGVFGLFVIYSLAIRHESPVLSKPTSLATDSTATTSTMWSGDGSGEGDDDGNIVTPNSNKPTTTPATTTTKSGKYKDGKYTGSSADAYYGNVKVAATITSGKITNIQFLDHPHTHRNSVEINNQAMPYLQQEAIQAQSSDVQIISGATFTSRAFNESLSSALSQARI